MRKNLEKQKNYYRKLYVKGGEEEMPMIEIDESWEDYDQGEEKRREEMFPVIERDVVKAQVTSWDLGESKKKHTPQIQWSLTILDDPEYAGKELIYRTPTTGRGKFILKNFLEAAQIKRAGKGVDPEVVVGKIVMLHLSVGATDEGRKYTNIDAVSAV